MTLNKTLLITAAFVLIGAGCTAPPADTSTEPANTTPTTEESEALPPAGDAMDKDDAAMEKPEEEPGDEKSSDAAEESEAMEGGGGATVVIGYYDDGFREEEVPNFTVKKGTAVSFYNFSSRPFWPASNVHPAHTILPEMDSKGPIQPGESYLHVFEKVGKWGIHDHLRANLGAVITVK